ncbi:MAG: primosomal protein N', partial [Oscillospiraceae bacterium]
RAIIQTIESNDDIINVSALQDYIKFYKTEIKIRKALLYPPFCQIATIAFKGKNEAETYKNAKDFMVLIKEILKDGNYSIPLSILGPSAFNILKVNDNYRYKVIIKCVNNIKFRDFLRKVLKIFYKSSNKNIILTVDFNSDT